MKPLLTLLAILGTAAAQDLFEEGAKVFRQTCAQGYCHGSGGTQGRAPKLIGRAYEAEAVMKIIREGVPNTGMPAFADRLDQTRLEAVTAYVIRISGGDASRMVRGGGGQSAETMPAEARRGRGLFTDPLRGVRRCNTCHVLESMGTAVGPNLASVASTPDAAAIRAVKAPSVRSAIVGNDRFPALVVEQADPFQRIYDLSVLPPVLRTLGKGEVSFSGGANWSHASAIENYSDADLAAIAAYLRWIAR